ncbi:PQ loop repeat, putative [Leishmania lindenbergi]|uniref:PQ loop repeat n=1 Tax=Leishmania lindenbergi TaxID=651832 RepID=A0AAW3A9E1_9TRYP
MEALKVCFEIALVIAPHIGYVAQYLEIHRTWSIEGYSPVVSLILLTSNTLRIYYYIGHPFLFALLCQAILGIAVHGIVLRKVLQVHLQQVLSAQSADMYSGDSASVSATVALEAPARATPSSVAGGGTAGKRGLAINDEDDTSPSNAAASAVAWLPSSREARNGFGGSGDASPSSAPSVGISCVAAKFLQLLFRIEDCIEAALLRYAPLQFVYSYLIVAVSALVMVLLYYISIGSVWKHAAEVVGYAALGIEALLVLPQILRHARRRSTEGLTTLLILTWVGGDVIKVVYFIYAKQALAFIVCGCFQLVLDVVVVAQVVYYGIIVKRESAVCVEGDDGAMEAVVSPGSRSTTNQRAL